MKNKITLILIFLSFTTLVWSQEYCKSGGKLFSQGKYEDAIKQYNACLIGQNTDDTKTFIQNKIQNAKRCIEWWNEGERNIKNKKWLIALEHFKNINNINPFDKEAGMKMELCIREGNIPNVQVVTEYKVDTVYITDTISTTEYITETVITTDTVIKIVTLPPPPNKLKFAPFGIKQFDNNQGGLGYTFAISQVAVPAIWFGVFYGTALNKYDKYENRTALTLEEHNKYFDDYKKYRSVAIWGAVGTGVLVYAINVICNYHCTNKNIAIKPQAFTDLQGNYGMGLTMNINF